MPDTACVYYIAVKYPIEMLLHLFVILLIQKL